VCSMAAGTGHLDVLKWSRAAGCPWNEQACEEAAGEGHMEILRWLHENGGAAR
jgi:hypothetical protein